MALKKVILYPFAINSSYFEGYAWAVELSIRMNAKLQLFTTTAIAPGITAPSDSIYHSLLQAHGYYLEHYNHSESKPREVSREPSITNGELKDDYLNPVVMSKKKISKGKPAAKAKPKAKSKSKAKPAVANPKAPSR